MSATTLVSPDTRVVPSKPYLVPHVLRLAFFPSQKMSYSKTLTIRPPTLQPRDRRARQFLTDRP